MTGAGRRVVVVGSINLDLLVRTPRHPRPGETVTGSKLEEGVGGKGLNQAVAAARAGSDVRMVGAVGDDDAGRAAVRELTRDGIDVVGIATREEARTGHALVTVDSAGENTIIVVPGANGALEPLPAVGLMHGVTEGDVVLLQNELPAATTAAAARRGREAGATVVWNAAPAPTVAEEVPAHVDVLVVNEHELGAVAALLGIEPDPDVVVLARETGRVLDALVVVTLGAAGSLVVDGDRTASVPASRVDVVDTTAAGDTFIGYLASTLPRRGLTAEHLLVAGTAAGLTVTRQGAASSIPSLADVDAALGLVPAGARTEGTTS